MADSSQAATSLLTEHLQYTPLTLIDDIINMVNNLMEQVLRSLETGLMAKSPDELGFAATKPTGVNGAEVEYPDAKQEIEEGLHKLETLFYSTVDKNFDKFEIFVLRNILSVPADLVNWMRLNHYENLSYPPPQNAPTIESIQLLRSRLTAERDASRALLKEHRRNAAILHQLRQLCGHIEGAPNNLAFLTNADPSQALTSNTKFAVSQLPALKSLLADLGPRLAALKDASTNVESAKDELKEERRGYIEQRTQAHVHRNGQSVQVASTVSGKVADPDEVQSMEKIAAIFDPT